MPTASRQLPSQKKTGVLSRIAPIKLLDDGIKIACFGRGGTGKTSLWSTFPKPILGILCSGAQETRSIHNVKGIDVVSLTEEAELTELIKHAREGGKYNTVVLDHASGFQELVLKKVLNLSEAPTQLSWGTASQSDWGDVALGMKDHLRNLLSLTCNVFIVAQERDFNTNSEGNADYQDVLTPFVNCALSPSVVGWFGPNVDYLVQTFIRKATIKETKKEGNKVKVTSKDVIQFCLRVGPHPVVSTKFRVPRGSKLPDIIVDPDYSKIAALIRGEVK